MGNRLDRVQTVSLFCLQMNAGTEPQTVPLLLSYKLFLIHYSLIYLKFNAI